MMKRTVVVGMSGGVDSSVAALLLKEQGYNVIGLFMKNWEETDAEGDCLATQDYQDVVSVCQQLEIPYYSVNFVEEYQRLVFSEFLDHLKQGLTPNPDILCNREIKFKVFFEKAKTLGADFLATGHYCRLDDSYRLLKGVDPEKDQSYFLSAVNGAIFNHVLFPIGHLYKQEVREIAKKNGLITSQKKESMGICFIGKRDFRPFLSKYLGYCPGPLMRLSGEVVGQHQGAAFYTIGQRKGLGVGGEGEAWYVVKKEIATNTVFIERGENHPALFSSKLVADQLSWIHNPPLDFPFRCSAKIRYRQATQDCTIHLINHKIEVLFDQPQRAITPGQSVVFYDNDVCLGQAMICV